MSDLILASARPQRKRLLEGLGLQFTVHPSDYDESACPELDPVKRAKILAYEKARTVNELYPSSFVLGCDTLVVAADDSLLEKAPNPDAARTMIGLLSGNTCQVHSAVSIVDPTQQHHEGVSSSSVTFAKLSDADIDWWIATELWRDRSGSFQIDGLGQLMIEHIEGDWSSIVGLPIYLVGTLLKDAGYDLYTTSSS